MEGLCKDKVWNMKGNIRKFLEAEKAYKRAYKHLMDVQAQIPINNEWRFIDLEEELNDDRLATWLKSEISYKDDYELFIEKGNELLAIINEIIPQDTELKFMVSVKNKLEVTRPIQNVLSCVCFYSAMNNLCEFVHLHRLPKEFKVGLYLVKKADKHIGLGVLHYAAIANNLIRLAKTDWTKKAIEEVLKLICRNCYTPYYPTVDDIRKEDALPLAEVAYKDHDGEPLSSVLVQLPEGCSFKGRFHLPLSFKGYVAKCRCTDKLIIGFRGTDNLSNVATDITQYLVGASLVYKMALGLLLEIKSQYGDNLLVVGHSLGGGLMQFAVAGLKESNVEGIGFNSAGLSDMAYKQVCGRDGNIIHFHLKTDQVFLIGHQIGRCCDLRNRVRNPITAHYISTMRSLLDVGSNLPYCWIS